MSDINMQQKKKYESLEALRGLAALCVFCGHLYAKNEGLPHTKLLSFVLNWGTESVIVFFILSGTVIHLSQEKNPKTWSQFFKNRLIRIYPLYFLSVLMAVGAVWRLGQKVDLVQVVGNLAFLQTMQAYIVNVLPTNNALWSLSSEMSFYLLFTFCLWRRQLIWVWYAGALAAVVLNVVPLSLPWLSYMRLQFAYSFIWLLGYTIATQRHRLRFERSFAMAVLPLAFMCARAHFSNDFYDIYRFLSFSVFVLPFFTVLISRSERVIKVPWYATVGCLAASSALLWGTSQSLFVTRASLTFVSIISILILFTFPSAFDKLWKLLSMAKRPLVYIGSLSYALYIIHLPVMYFLQTTVPGHPFFVAAATFVIVIALSHFLELSFQPRLSRRLKSFSLMDFSATPVTEVKSETALK